MTFPDEVPRWEGMLDYPSVDQSIEPPVDTELRDILQFARRRSMRQEQFIRDSAEIWEKTLVPFEKEMLIIYKDSEGRQTTGIGDLISDVAQLGRKKFLYRASLGEKPTEATPEQKLEAFKAATARPKANNDLDAKARTGTLVGLAYLDEDEPNRILQENRKIAVNEIKNRFKDTVYKMEPEVLAVLIDMHFAQGLPSALKFKNFEAAVRASTADGISDQAKAAALRIAAQECGVGKEAVERNPGWEDRNKQREVLILEAVKRFGGSPPQGPRMPRPGMIP